MNQLQIFLPCAAGVEDYLALEVTRITDQAQVEKWRAGVLLQGSWRDAMLLNPVSYTHLTLPTNREV